MGLGNINDYVTSNDFIALDMNVSESGNMIYTQINKLMSEMFIEVKIGSNLFFLVLTYLTSQIWV